LRRLDLGEEMKVITLLGKDFALKMPVAFEQVVHF
jgi:hypothetical protein